MTEKLIILKTFVEVRWLRKFKTKEAVKKHQEKMIVKQLKYLKKNSPFFKDVDPSMNGFKNLPIMNKQIMMDNFNDLNTVGIDRDEAMEIAINSEKSREFKEKCNGISVGLSSGTSGHRGLFIISDRDRSLWAGAAMAKLLPKKKMFGNKIAFFLRADNNLYETVKSKFMEFEYFDIYEDFKSNMKKLNKYQPTVLIAPPSVLMLIANAIENKTINIDPVKVISVAEVLTEKDEEYFKKVFNKEIIYQVYQCTEGFIGYKCECGTFHINEDVVFIEKEYIDKDRFIPIVTDYIRRTQPIIRYRLNDILVDSNKTCECGLNFMAIEKIEGRTDDMFIFNDKNNNEITVFPDFISRCIIYVDGIKDYKIVQKQKNQVIIYLDVVTPKIKKDIENEFLRLADKMQFIMPKFEYKKYQVDMTKKLKRVERSFAHEKN
ncbi:MAG: CoF synthetase [Bacilli bacterium]|nr:CoF synthetase [Bacilli bacterium]